MLILDGWGVGSRNAGNPIANTPIPTIDFVRTHYPCGALQSAGIAVGLPWGEEGNSEVGHLTLGSGRVLYQHYPRITIAIRDGSFFKNPALLGAIEHARKNNGALHLAGLFGKGNVHSSYDHILALLKLAAEQSFQNVRLHLFTDGKDSGPKSGADLEKKLAAKLTELGFGSIVSISGRYYAMDRDGHWDRTEKAHNAMIGKGRAAVDAETVFKDAYGRAGSDEFIEPASISPTECIKDGDALIFFDFREDSVRQITESFINPEFNQFSVVPFQNLHVVTMTRYKETFTTPVAFPPDKIENPLGKVIADNEKFQMRIAETEKYAHVTSFFNGLKDGPFKNEYRVLVPSQNVPHHDAHPEMQTREVTNRLLEALNEGVYDFILVNFAASDIIAHTGNYQAAQKAIQIIDQEVARILEAIRRDGHILVITADHGNLEQMLDPFTGEPETKHNPNPVPIYLVANEYEREVDMATAEYAEAQVAGILSDVAPTILHIMGIPKPDDMTGNSLLSILLTPVR